MSNIDKQADSVSRIIADLKLKHGSGDTYAPIMRWHELLALLDELEAKDKQIADSESRVSRQNRHVCELFDENAALRQRIAELEALQGKPVMFIDGDISPADAEKLAAVIREFSEETETPAARMARIIRENPHPTNMCDMPAAGTAKGE